MTVSEYAVKYGIVAALRAINDEGNQMATDLLNALAYKNHVVKTEGVMPIEERPEQTQAFLNVATKVIQNADYFLFEVRKLDVDAPNLESLIRIEIDLNYEITTSQSFEDAKPLILMRDRVADEIRALEEFINECLIKEE